MISVSFSPIVRMQIIILKKEKKIWKESQRVVVNSEEKTDAGS